VLKRLDLGHRRASPPTSTSPAGPSWRRQVKTLFVLATISPVNGHQHLSRAFQRQAVQDFATPTAGTARIRHDHLCSSMAGTISTASAIKTSQVWGGTGPVS